MSYLHIKGGEAIGTQSVRLGSDETTSGPSLTAGWDYEGNGEAVIYSDRLGIIPLFYYGTDEELIVATSLAEVATRLPHGVLDNEAIAAFLSIGYYVGDRTPLAGVHTLAPSSRITYRRGRIQAAHEAPIPHPFQGSIAEAREGYAQRFAEAISKRNLSPVRVLPISGGRDSRHILYELDRQDTKPEKLVTLTTEKSEDAAVARTIAERLRIPLETIEHTRDFVRLEQQKNPSNNYVTDENGWFLDLLGHLDGPLFDGLAGDVLSNDLYFDQACSRLLQTGNIAEGGEHFIKRFAVKHRSYLSRDFAERWGHRHGAELIKTELSKYAEWPDPIKAFIFYNRTRREIAMMPLSMASDHVPIRLPYLDEGVFDLLMSLPYETFNSTHLHDQVIEETYSDYADIPYGRKTKPKWETELRNLAAMVRASTSPMLNRSRIGYYAAEAAARGNTYPFKRIFSRYYPLIAITRLLRNP